MIDVAPASGVIAIAVAPAFDTAPFAEATLDDTLSASLFVAFVMIPPVTEIAAY